jgi:hypothetical protein
LNSKSLAFRDFHTSINYYPNVLLINEPIETTSCVFYVNRIGCVVSFQFIGDKLNESEIYDIYKKYDTIEDENKNHVKLKKEILKTFGLDIEPDSISNVAIDMFEELIKPHYYRINNDKTQTFIEALFIFQLCKSFEQNLNNNLLYQADKKLANIIFTQANNLFNLEDPRHFFINQIEKNKMEIFYDSWDLKYRVKTLKERYKLTILNNNYLESVRNKKQSFILNIFLIILTFLSLIEIVPILKSIYQFDEKIQMIVLIVFISILIFILFIKEIIQRTKEIIYKFKEWLILKKIFKNRI